MIDPLWALVLMAALLYSSYLLWWPGRGLWWRFASQLRTDERVLMEDALKHLYDCEYRRAPATVASLAGVLERPIDQAAALVGRLVDLGLVKATGESCELTGAGRSDALRVIRIHRLWERYLADETGFEATHWHAEADRREHSVSAAEADALAARLGNPRFDPHGDPIPTRRGELTPRVGHPLIELAAGDAAQIVHVEDEPEAVYAQLLAEGLHPGMRIRLLDITRQRVHFESDDAEHVLAPVVAANLSVVPLAQEEAAEVVPAARLSSLRVGECARVTGLAAACRGTERRRLFDLGVVPGTDVVAELSSPLGDPVAYRVRGCVLALRRDQADMIHIERPLADHPTKALAS